MKLNYPWPNEFYRKILAQADVEWLYFKCKLNLNTNNNKEYVEGYAQIDKNGSAVVDINSQKYLAIKTVPVDIGLRKDINPITLAGLTVIRNDFPEIAYPGFKDNGVIEGIIKTLATMINEVANIFRGFEIGKMKKGWCKNIETTNGASWIRLADPTYQKFGGGSRVHEITFDDSWNNVSGESASMYGQKFIYEKTHQLSTGEEITISSGVANYEPLTGGEEYLGKNPLFYDQRMILSSNRLNYVETPMCESLYPSPVIGYSKVKIASINKNQGRNSTGYEVKKFYTTRDFPYREEQTKLYNNVIESNLINKLLKFNYSEDLALSQGHHAFIHNMHGKLKSSMIYNDYGAVVSGSEYEYYTDEEGNLSNEVDLMGIDGNVANGYLGETRDVWSYMDEEESSTITAGVSGNVDIIPIPLLFAVLPIPVPSIYPKLNFDRKNVSKAVLTKVTHQLGILKTKTTIKDGSSIDEEYLVFDKDSGKPVVTSTTNEFGEKVYSTNIPAFYVHDKMGPAYKNLGASFHIEVNNGVINDIDPPGTAQDLKSGDEVYTYNTGNDSEDKFYIAEPSTNLVMMDEGGNLAPDGNYLIKITRSHNRNYLNEPAQIISSLEYPIVNGHLTLNADSKVLNAKAFDYQEERQMICNVDSTGDFQSDTINPYFEGILGRPFQDSSFVYHDDRQKTGLSNDTYVSNGYTVNFDPYWTYTGGTWQPATSNNKWVRTNTIEYLDVSGNVLQSLDGKGMQSSAEYEFNKKLVSAVCENAEYQEIGFENFEWYSLAPVTFCNDLLYTSGLGFENHVSSWNGINRVDSLAHTGHSCLGLNVQSNESIKYNLNTNCSFNPQLKGGQTKDRVEESDTFDNLEVISGGKQFMNNCEACIERFTPKSGEEYVISYWSRIQNCGCDPDASAKITLETNDSIYNTYKVGPPIDRWQKHERKFTVPAENTITLRIKNNQMMRCSVFLDDLRIHPTDASFISFVYDFKNERLMAELDENNYATFYEYDDKGNLVRVKKETEEGVLTIKESRSNISY